MNQPIPHATTAPDRAEPGATEAGNAVVRRLIAEVLTGGRLDVIPELYTPDAARGTAVDRALPRVLPRCANGDRPSRRRGRRRGGAVPVLGHASGPWRGQPPTGRRFEEVDEVYFFELRGGRIARAWGLEDTASRLRQLGLPG